MRYIEYLRTAPMDKRLEATRAMSMFRAGALYEDYVFQRGRWEPDPPLSFWQSLFPVSLEILWMKKVISEPPLPVHPHQIKWAISVFEEFGIDLPEFVGKNDSNTDTDKMVAS